MAGRARPANPFSPHGAHGRPPATRTSGRHIQTCPAKTQPYKTGRILRKQPSSGPAKAVTAGSSAPATGHRPVAPARSRHRIPPSRTAHTDGIHPWPQAGWHSSALRSGADSCNPLPFTRTGKFRIRTVMQSSAFPAMPDLRHATPGMPATDQHVVFFKTFPLARRNRDRGMMPITRECAVDPPLPKPFPASGRS